MKDFILYWLTGRSEIIKGSDIADAMNRAGYGNGAIRALDFYSEYNEENKNDYVWNKTEHTWHLTPEARKRKFNL